MLTEDLQVRRHPLPSTEHPPWMAAMIATLEGPWQRAAWPRLFAETAAGQLPPLAAWRRVLVDFFVIVESFPKYMALSLAKTTYGQRAGDARVRRWLLQNIAVEGRHAEWYLDWLDAVGVSPEEAVAHIPCDETRALHDHLWQVCDAGSLAEGIAATNWAIEGVTGLWSRGVAETFRGYASDGVRIDARSSSTSTGRAVGAATRSASNGRRGARSSCSPARSNVVTTSAAADGGRTWRRARARC